MKKKKLAVSGDSEVLRWLVDTSLEMTPWLTITNKGLKIDTEAAVKEWERSTGKAVTKEMSLAKKLLEEIHFEELFGEQVYEEEDNFLAAPIPIPEEVKKILADLKKTMEGLSESIKPASSKTKRRYSLGSKDIKEIQQLCAKICKVIDKVHYMQISGSFNLSAGRRYKKVAKGDIIELLYASDKARYPSEDAWPLAKRLVKAQADLYFKLESIIKEKKELEGKSFQDLDISSSLKSLAILEQRLGKTLLQVDDDTNSESYLYEIDRTFVILDKQMKPIDDIKNDKNFSFLQGGESSSPLDQLGRYLTSILSEITDSLFYYMSQDNIRNFIMKSRYLMSDLSDIDDELDEKIQNKNFGMIEDFFDWVLRESPFMTLIYSGFLSIVIENKRSRHVSLSPWLTTSVTAKKIFGSLPLTHVEGRSNYDWKDQNREDEPKTDISGRWAWSKVHGHGDYQH